MFDVLYLVQINIGGRYERSDMVLVSSIGLWCSKATGLSAPKVLKITGTDGIERRVILKVCK